MNTLRIAKALSTTISTSTSLHRTLGNAGIRNCRCYSSAIIIKRSVSNAFQCYTSALVRDIDDSLATSALTKDPNQRASIDIALAKAQHAQLVDALEATGVKIHTLKSDGFPDSVFIEDTVVIIDNTAILTNPGAEERKGEVAAVQHFLSSQFSDTLQVLPFDELKLRADIYKPLIEQHGQSTEGKLDGGDVLFTGRDVFVGLSDRSDMLGMFVLQVALPQYAVHGVNMRALAADAAVISKQLAKRNAAVAAVAAAAAADASHSPVIASFDSSRDGVTTTTDALHLKSFCSMLPDGTILVGGNMGLAFQHYLRENFLYDRAYKVIHIPDMAAANCVVSNGHVLRRAAIEFPNSESVWQSLNLDQKVTTVDCSELAKVDGAITCCSVLF